MARKAGIPITALFETTDQIRQALPAKKSEVFNQFLAIDVHSRVSDGAGIETGKLQSLDVALADQDAAPNAQVVPRFVDPIAGSDVPNST